MSELSQRHTVWVAEFNVTACNSVGAKHAHQYFFCKSCNYTQSVEFFCKKQKDNITEYTVLKTFA
jgi:hypothetical protein